MNNNTHINNICNNNNKIRSISIREIDLVKNYINIINQFLRDFITSLKDNTNIYNTKEINYNTNNNFNDNTIYLIIAKLKSLESLKTKLLTECRKKNKIKNQLIDYNSNTANITWDIIRYTIVCSINNLNTVISKFIELINKNPDYEIINVKNTICSPTLYPGINIRIKYTNQYDKKSRNFELQFHTPETIIHKEKIHKIYEEYRTETDDNNKKCLKLKLIKMNDKFLNSLSEDRQNMYNSISLINGFKCSKNTTKINYNNVKKLEGELQGKCSNINISGGNKTKKAKFFTPQARLTKGQRKYCACLMHVRGKGQKPYGICRSSITKTAKRLRKVEPNQYKPGTLFKANCTLSYQYENFSLKEVQELAKERKIPITYVDSKSGKRKQYSQNKLVEFITNKEYEKLKNKTNK